MISCILKRSVRQKDLSTYSILISSSVTRCFETPVRKETGDKRKVHSVNSGGVYFRKWTKTVQNISIKRLLKYEFNR